MLYNPCYNNYYCSGKLPNVSDNTGDSGLSDNTAYLTVFSNTTTAENTQTVKFENEEENIDYRRKMNVTNDSEQLEKQPRPQIDSVYENIDEFQ